MLKFNQDVRQRIGNVIMLYRLVDVNAPVVITFPPADHGVAESEAWSCTPWGFDFLTSQKINTISFADIGEHFYYHSAEFVNFIELLAQELVIFPQRLGYGVSKGGFGVSLHADRLGLDRALLMMPLSTFNDKKAPWDSAAIRASKAVDCSSPLNDSCRCQTPLTIIFDPLNPRDRRQAVRFRSTSVSLKLPGVGHRIPRALQELGLLKKLVLDFIHNRLDTDAFPGQVRKRRTLSVYYRNLLSNPTQKLTFKRKIVLYYHKLNLQLANIEDEPARILCRIKQSLRKRKYLVEKCHIQLQHVIAERQLALCTAMVFCL
ncbi:hypothetical protein Ssed_4030 [Shewanella sediminis HAW-EB3]|uniref:Cytosolic protein n=1 Tax=Shewanella sediminis (strain HAW-EB3) TaxID=425104 RepID=A8G0L1_SHESH|nr:hypothetical protein [Shewanella sediminis]ABV38634.1 hypothetical protein Ssed_4030 [Shewanella sediminis HAW-EB3]